MYIIISYEKLIDVNFIKIRKRTYYINYFSNTKIKIFKIT